MNVLGEMYYNYLILLQTIALGGELIWPKKRDGGGRSSSCCCWVVFDIAIDIVRMTFL